MYICNISKFLKDFNVNSAADIGQALHRWDVDCVRLHFGMRPDSKSSFFLLVQSNGRSMDAVTWNRPCQVSWNRMDVSNLFFSTLNMHCQTKWCNYRINEIIDIFDRRTIRACLLFRVLTALYVLKNVLHLSFAIAVYYPVFRSLIIVICSHWGFVTESDWYEHDHRQSYLQDVIVHLYYNNVVN